MKYKAKAPLRLGLAGGGTDVSPYCDKYNGAVVNATISLYAHCCITSTHSNCIEIKAHHQQNSIIYNKEDQLPIDGCLDLAKGVYNCLQKDYSFKHNGLKIETSVDAPLGSGLGTSSTLVVAILGAFIKMLDLNFTLTEMAAYAYKIERDYLQFAGGKQDQFAATFGGFNLMQFYENNLVVVNPIVIAAEKLLQLQNNLLLYYTQSSRDSGTIIKEQQQNVHNENIKSIEAMHQLKKLAIHMRIILEKEDVDNVGKMLHDGFLHKQQMAKNITNQTINTFYTTAMQAGSSGGKISGAGGGGFMFFYCPNNTKPLVSKALQQLGGSEKEYVFVQSGLEMWTENS